MPKSQKVSSGLAIVSNFGEVAVGRATAGLPAVVATPPEGSNPFPLRQLYFTVATNCGNSQYW